MTTTMTQGRKASGAVGARRARMARAGATAPRRRRRRKRRARRSARRGSARRGGGPRRASPCTSRRRERSRPAHARARAPGEGAGAQLRPGSVASCGGPVGESRPAAGPCVSLLRVHLFLPEVQGVGPAHPGPRDAPGGGCREEARQGGRPGRVSAPPATALTGHVASLAPY